jgi:quercetin dioxygenase-like cupin family protein
LPIPPEVRDVAKFIHVGYDDECRSSILRTVELPAGARTVNLIEGLAIDSTFPGPPRDSAGVFLDLEEYGIRCPQGTVFWSVFAQSPGETFDMHYTDTLDFDVLLSGSTTLRLERGEVDLNAGDCVLIEGVPHAWSAGPEGCGLSSLVLGVAIDGAPATPRQAKERGST